MKNPLARQRKERLCIVVALALGGYFSTPAVHLLAITSFPKLRYEQTHNPFGLNKDRVGLAKFFGQVCCPRVIVAFQHLQILVPGDACQLQNIRKLFCNPTGGFVP